MMHRGDPGTAPADPERLHAAAAARVGIGTAITSGAWVAARALALVTLVLLVRALPSDDLGALLAATAAGLLGATLATGGLPDATTRVAASAAEGDGFGRGDLHAALRRFALTCPVIVLLLAAIADGPRGLDVDLLVASTLLAVTQGGTSILASVFRARGQAGRYALVSGLIVAVGRVVVAGAAVAVDASAGLVLWSFVALNAAVIALVWRRAVGGLPDTRSPGHGEGALHLGGAVWALLAHLDVVVVGVLIGADAAGVYGATLRLAEFSYQVLVAVTVLYLPEATTLAITDRRRALIALYRTSSRWSALVCLALAGGGFVAAPWLAELLFPDDASTSAMLMRILLVGYAAYGALGLGYLTSVALGEYRAIRWSAIVALPGIVGATVAFAELWGVNGAACATAAGYVLFNTWWILHTRSTLGATPFDLWYVRAVIACGLGWGAGALTALGVSGAAAPLAVVAIGAATGAAWVLATLALGALRPAELRAVLRRLRRRRSRVQPDTRSAG